MSQINFKKMKERYGDMWHIFPPPEARPFFRTEHKVIPDFNSQVKKIELVKYVIPGNRVSIISQFGVRGFIDLINPDSSTEMQPELSAVDLSGRISWSMRLGDTPAMDSGSNLNAISNSGDTFANELSGLVINSKKEDFAADISILGMLGGDSSLPNIIVPPGTRANIRLNIKDQRAGSGEPADSDFRIVAILQGYTLDIA